MSHERISKIMDYITEHALQFTFQFIGACIIIFIGWLLARFLAKLTYRALNERKVDITIQKFTVFLVRWLVLALALLFALSNLGVQIAPLIAGMSVAGVGISLALQGPLSNYAAGVTLIFTKPFKVGEIIDVKGYMGEVSDISLPRTELLGLDGSRIIIPNKHIIGEVIKNFSDHRKLEINVGVSYDTNIDQALEILKNILKSNPLIHSENLIKVGINELADSAINLQAHVKVFQSDYIEVKFAVNKAIIDEFRKNKISIPYPQRDVHIYQAS